ncbi:MAG TPA: RHS repeat-associated core domain-containing protein, partial [Nevskia sp.]|nr:RHS repeat-associated core domain-containing protein [Nevskia sp.]
NYTAWGAPQTIDGPRTDVSDVTQVAYYPIVSGDSKSGQIHTVTDALGHVTTVNSYDGSGRPLQVTDPNGLLTTLTYTPRGWLASRQVGTELTQYAYYPTGLLQRITLPNGAYLQYNYNAAHQLTDVYDQLGDHIQYTPDVMGNNTAVKVYDPSGTLVQAHSRVYNSLNELYQDVGAQNQTTTYGYDNNGNVTSVTDPLSHTTGSGYDALDRLAQVTDPASGVTHYAYNALDQLTGVTDPRSLATTYTTDALGNTGTLQSPDSGTSTASYDAAGNVLARTDAKNQTSHYQYDALNRLTLITRADSSTISFSYDQGTNGIGHLTGMVDASGSTAWSYDSHGRVIERDQTIGTLTLSTLYGYDASGQLATMTLPSGDLLSYTWTHGQITAIGANGQSLVSGLAWQPFSGPASWTFGNGETVSRSYDLDGRVSATAVQSSVGYDNASRIAGVTLGNHSVLSGGLTYGYDTLDRLTSVSGNTSLGYGYDATGNRSSQATPAGSASYTVDSASNRIALITQGTSLTTPAYDANGSLTQDQVNGYAYDTAGRLAGLTNPGPMGIASYSYDGMGRRVSKTVGSGVTLFNTDEQGRLIGEYDASGALIEETIYLGGMPVAVLAPPLVSTSGGQRPSAYFIHADHLGTPRQIDNAAGTAVWTWDAASFGDARPNQDPASSGTQFVYNLRFAGQYYDAESGLFYNLNRYYDPAVGRYTTSDPIGLRGGINTYAYAGGNPIGRIDPLGLEAPCVTLGAECLNQTAVQSNVAAYLAWRQRNLDTFNRALNGDPDAADDIAMGFVGGIWTSPRNLSSVENAFLHWKKHAQDFPNCPNAKTYVEQAKNFLDNPPVGALTKIRPNGDILVYDPATNTFVAANASGVPRTMFKPTDGMSYWGRQ